MQPDSERLPVATRREFLKSTAIGATVAAAALTGLYHPASAQEKASTIHFPPLPYPENSLEPYLSAKTLNIHYNKHHRKYVEQVIERIKGTEYQNATLEKIIKETHGGINMMDALNLMAVMAWNHNFYWQSMKPKGGGELPARLKQDITGAFGSVDEFKKKFKEAAMTFGSGWAWLVLDKGKPAVTYTSYHESPIVLNQTPLLTMDCWEHAYYLDYQDRKGDYVDAFINNLANWTFAESNLPPAVPAAAATKKSEKK
jgi:superoxide dismutase, Fe-Mn family